MIYSRTYTKELNKYKRIFLIVFPDGVIILTILGDEEFLIGHRVSFLQKQHKHFVLRSRLFAFSIYVFNLISLNVSVLLSLIIN